MLSISFLLLSVAAIGTVAVRRIASNPFVRLLGAGFECWAEQARHGPELTSR